MPTTVPDDLVPIRDVPHRRPLTFRQLRHLRETGQVPTWTLGRRAFVSLADVDAQFRRTDTPPTRSREARNPQP